MKGWSHLAVVAKSKLVHRFDQAISHADEIYPFVVWLLAAPGDEVAEYLRDAKTLAFLHEQTAGTCLFFLPVDLPSDDAELKGALDGFVSALPESFQHYFTETQEEITFREQLKSLGLEEQELLADLPVAVVVSDYSKPPILIPLSVGDSRAGRLSLLDIIEAARESCRGVLGKGASAYLNADQMTGWRRFLDHPDQKVQLRRAFRFEIEKRKLLAHVEPSVSAGDLLQLIGLFVGWIGGKL